VPASTPSDFIRVVFDTGLIRIGAFRCRPSHPCFHDSGPARTCCFVFPRTAVEIQHEDQHAFAANPNVVTFYNEGQRYARRAISQEGDRCDWFAVRCDVVRDVVRDFDPAVDAHPDKPFRRSRGYSDASAYLFQRRLFNHVARGEIGEPLAIEESVLRLLERVVRMAYRGARPSRVSTVGPRQAEIVRYVEQVLSKRWYERMTLRDIASTVGLSPFHLCRLFRRATGTGLHQYRQQLRVRGSLEGVVDASKPIVEVALEAGFSSHSHYSSTFHREFGRTPSSVRTYHKARTARSAEAQYFDSSGSRKSARKRTPYR
jgi:AraC family transcriptional regulator